MNKEDALLQSQLKILFVDDHAGLRDALSVILTQNNPTFKILTSGTEDEAISIFTENPDTQIVILDLNLNSKSGLDLIPRFRKINPQIKIIIYTMFNDPLNIEKALAYDIQGYVTKEVGTEEIERIINSVNAGDICLNNQAKEIMKTLMTIQNAEDAEDSVAQLFSRYKTLSKKEQEIFVLLAQRKEPHEIAQLLGKTEKTVQNQKSTLYQKLNVHDKLEVIEVAKTLGVIL